MVKHGLPFASYVLPLLLGGVEDGGAGWGRSTGGLVTTAGTDDNCVGFKVGRFDGRVVGLAVALLEADWSEGL